MTREEEFNKLANEWDEGTKFFSFWHMSIKHPAYPKLLAFGKEAIPFVLKRLVNNKSIDWSFLLCELTGEHPKYEPEQECGFVKFDIHALANAWLKWGREHGYEC